MFLCLESKQCKKFRTFWRKSQEVSEQMKLTVKHFLILNWQKKVKRQGWDCIFQKKKKGLKSSELFCLLFCGCVFFLLYCPLQDQSCNRKRQINELFFFSKKAKQLYIVCCFPFTWNDCANEDPFPIKGTALVNVENDFAQQGQCKRWRHFCGQILDLT